MDTKKIKLLCIDKGISNNELAKAIGCSRQALWTKFKNNKLTAQDIEKIENFLKCKKEDFC